MAIKSAPFARRGRLFDSVEANGGHVTRVRKIPSEHLPFGLIGGIGTRSSCFKEDLKAALTTWPSGGETRPHKTPRVNQMLPGCSI